MQSPGSQGTRDASTPEIEEVFSLAADPQLAENSRQGSERKNRAFALGFEELKSQTMQWGSWQASGRTASVPTVYLYDGDSLINEVNAGGSVIAQYVHSQGIDDPMSLARAGIASYFQADAQGSVTSLSSASGSLTNTYSYDAYGKTVGSTGTITNPFQYTAREFDSETQLYYYRARYYDPKFGRLISEDPSLFVGGQNFYDYVANDPVNLQDPFGLQALPKPIGPVPAPPLGPVLVPPPPAPSTIETILGWLGDVVSTAGGVGSIVLLNPTPLNQAELDWQWQRDHDRYKDVCSGEVLAGGSPCANLAREIARAIKCIQLMRAFDAKWAPGRHSGNAIDQWENGLENLKKEYDRDCTPQKPQNCPKK